MPEFLNLSFELPDGIAATVLSANSEPFGLADEQSLLLSVDGGTEQSVLFEIGSRGTVLSTNTETYVLVDGQTLTVSVDGGAAATATFNTADFDNIALATASEVAAVILTDIPGVFVFVESGAVRITTITKGASGSVNVTGGTANGVLGFPVGANPGVDDFVDITNATAAEVAAQINAQTTDITAADDGGAVRLTSDTLGTSSSIRVNGGSANVGLAFDLDLHVGVTRGGYAENWTIDSTSTYGAMASFDVTFPEPVEDFEEEWGQAVATFSAAEFNPITGPHTFDGFEVEWDNGPTSLGAQAAAAFVDTSASGGVETFEDFETFPTGSPTPTPTFFTAQFDVALDDFEDFEEEWGQAVAPSFSAAVFGTGVTFEAFEPVTLVQEIVTVNALETGELYVVTINSEPAVVTGSVSTGNIASDLETAINNLSQPVSATAVGSTVEVQHDEQGTPFVMSVTGPPSNPAALTFAEPDPTTQWNGNSLFCL